MTVDVTPTSTRTVSAEPVKRFFVEMLTRDILVEDAILDLLDNCVDGVIRLTNAGKNSRAEGDKPWADYYAKIDFDKESFSIEDNCGGIPWSEHDRAFKMGRPSGESQTLSQDEIPTIGVYGIGMKRAIFKIGEMATIDTQCDADRYRVDIPPDWIRGKIAAWDLEVVDVSSRMPTDGTRIHVTQLYEGISSEFSSESFLETMVELIENQYAIMLGKGLQVSVNGRLIKEQPLRLRYSNVESATDATEIRPYIFSGSFNNVKVFIAIGLREPIPTEDEIEEAITSTPYRSQDAGWSVVCNDRVVVSFNKDELTGWNTSGLPAYHTQYRAISGTVEFSGHAADLPTTTTKRGLNATSPLYLLTIDRMRFGLSKFTTFTNWWKGREEEARRIVESADALTLREIKEKATNQLELTDTRKSDLVGRQYQPKLARPAKQDKDLRISYVRERKLIFDMADALLPGQEFAGDRALARAVGEKSFDIVYDVTFTGEPSSESSEPGLQD